MAIHQHIIVSPILTYDLILIHKRYDFWGLCPFGTSLKTSWNIKYGINKNTFIIMYRNPSKDAAQI